MLHAVVDCGSFANAAEFLHVSQPAISYTIAKLEELLGVRILKLEGRKAHITEPGIALLERSRFLLREAVELEEFAESLRHGRGTEVKLAVDKSFPTRVLVPALRMFSLQREGVKVHLFEVSGTKIEKALQDRSADLAISGYVPIGSQGNLLIEIEYVAVAHPDHPLFGLQRELSQADLDREMRVVCSDELGGMMNENPGASGTALRWHVSSFDTAESVLSECLGYGWLPKDRVQKSLDSGKLKILPLTRHGSYRTSFYLVHARPSAVGSEASRLADVLHSVASVTMKSTN